VFRLVKAMGGRFPRVVVVACEPEWLGGEDGAMGLSDTVQAAIGEAVASIEELLQNTGGVNV
jgi:hypothetical protein